MGRRIRALPMIAPQPARIFISYATRDGAAYAATLRGELEARSHNVWQDIAALEGEPVLIMGSTKSGAIEQFPVLKAYHDIFTHMLGQPGTKLMVIGYSFQDDHINQMICNASARTGLGTFLVDPNGRDALKDPKMAGALPSADG